MIARIEWKVDSEEEYETMRGANQLPGEAWSLLQETDLNELSILQGALNKWGEQLQADLLIEEMAELTQAIIKARRKGLITTKEKLIEEVVDVDIMMAQFKIYLNNWLHEYPPLYANLKEQKLQRLKARIEGKNGN